MDRINFLGYPVDNLNISDALTWIDQSIHQQTPRRISVINANKLWQMSRDSRLKNIVQYSDLVIPEWAVYWGASKLGTPLKSSVYGVVLLKEFLPWAEKKGYRPFFLGAKQETIDALVARLACDYPTMKIAGAHHGYFQSKEENDQICKIIYESHADVLFVAMGSPRQEYWIAENLTKVNVSVAMGVGGSFDVISGQKADTPNWARGHGIEWIYRLSQNPRLYWKRYMITNPWFIWQVYKAKHFSKRKQQ